MVLIYILSSQGLTNDLGVISKLPLQKARENADLRDVSWNASDIVTWPKYQAKQFALQATWTSPFPLAVPLILVKLQPFLHSQIL